LHVDKFLNEKLPAEMPVISMFIGDKTISKFKGVFMAELNTLFPDLMKQYVSNLKNEVNFGKIVSEKIAAFPTDKLENLLIQLFNKELRLFKMAGALLGFLIGILQIGLSILIL
jgi:uncharacterized membrane protein YheB (UPF0754 family)